MENLSIVNDKKVINAWSMYDWANSAYSLVILTAIFPIYFSSVSENGYYEVFGRTFSESSLLSYAFSVAYVIIAIVSPTLSGIADYSGRRKLFLRFFTYMGAIGCIALVAFQDAHKIEIGIIALIVATIGFAGGQVFYNAYLSIIATPDRYDRVSARGFAYGYVGSLILLFINLFVFLKYDWLGLEGPGVAARIGFVIVGIWWIGFAQIPFAKLPNDESQELGENLLWKGFHEIRNVWMEMKYQIYTKRFLIAFFCYSAASQTVFFVATLYATNILEIEQTPLILTIILLQLIAILGAWYFAKLSERYGNRFALIVILLTWMLVCVGAYALTEDWQFYVIAAVLGLVMGGIQSLSRATYAKLMPSDHEDPTSYFSFYDVLEKLAIVVGTFSFGFIEQITGSMRNSVLFLILFFIIGVLLLLRVKVVEGEKQWKQYSVTQS